MGEGKDRKMKKTDLRGILFLVFAAMIWGFALVAQKAGTENLGPLTFTGLRCMLGSLSMIPPQFFSKSVFNTQPLENLVLSLRSISY